MKSRVNRPTTVESSKPMKKFESYEEILNNLLHSPKNAEEKQKQFRQINASLDGQPSKYLRDKVKLHTLRKWGAFFTGHALADKLIVPLKKKLLKGGKILDPACGAGDLLIACARILPVKKTVFGTIKLWGELLYGFDVHPSFIKTTKLRLILLAKKLCNFTGTIEIKEKDLFTNIKIGDFFKQRISSENFDIIVTNPPYIYNRIPKGCSWSTGLTSIAGLFIEKCISISNENTIIAAILPDVLRSGTRYIKWREAVCNKVKKLRTKIVGKFDSLTDVDVFRLYLTIGKTHSIPTWFVKPKIKLVFGDVFDVKVGPVVPFRDPKKGKYYLYIEPSNVRAWGEITPKKVFRRFNRTVYEPPFVVVRRTSGPSDKIRAIASIIKGKRALAVENHLLILKPKNGGIKLCRSAKKTLKTQAVTNWLNKKIRCRHLTVESIMSMPWRVV